MVNPIILMFPVPLKGKSWSVSLCWFCSVMLIISCVILGAASSSSSSPHPKKKDAAAASSSVVSTTTNENYPNAIKQKGTTPLITTSTSNDSTSSGTLSSLSLPLHMVYFGNSILQVNNCPGLLHNMIVAGLTNNTNNNDDISGNSIKSSFQQDQCLMGGATFTSLWGEWDERCPLLEKYVMDREDIDQGSVDDDEWQQPIATLQGEHDWDYVIMNDQTQSPAREWSREMSVIAIRKRYGPLMMLNKKKRTIPIIIQTAAYKKPNVMGSDDLGNFDEFSDALVEGVKAYVKAFNEALFPRNNTNIVNEDDVEMFGARIAPVGEAYRWLRYHNIEMYDKLYSSDSYHPSPYGTWLQACIIYITCFRLQPPPYDSSWIQARSTNVPTNEEAILLARTACQIMDLNCELTRE